MLAVLNEIDVNSKYISGFEEKRVDGFETDRKCTAVYFPII
jgi:hypothetical protein